jgi:F-type H+-transporting ATPase subunit alpha
MQSEFVPVSMSAQITVLVALTAKLFDALSLKTMPEAEQAVRNAAEELPIKLIERLESDKHLTEEDKTTILAIAKNALEPFMVESEKLSELP